MYLAPTNVLPDNRIQIKYEMALQLVKVAYNIMLGGKDEAKVGDTSLQNMVCR